MVLAALSLNFEIKLTEEGIAFNGAHYAFTTDISRSFNAFEYRNEGFVKSISANDNMFQLATAENVFVRKAISQTTVKYFSFPWIDTSGISLI